MYNYLASSYIYCSVILIRTGIQSKIVIITDSGDDQLQYGVGGGF